MHKTHTRLKARDSKCVTQKYNTVQCFAWLNRNNSIFVHVYDNMINVFLTENVSETAIHILYGKCWIMVWCVIKIHHILYNVFIDEVFIDKTQNNLSTNLVYQ